MANTMNWPDILSGLVRGEDQPAEATAWAMGQILNGDATPAQLAAFVIGLRSKGETVEELTGLADMMIEFATPIEIGGPAVDVVGSGGDRSNTVNISTMAAIVAAAAGARVVKHGNRAASSACGAADVLEALGLVLDLAPEAQQQVVDQVGIGFLFAAHYHPALRHAAATRRELGIPTTFNFLGPLANPAQPISQAVGVADPRMAELMAGVFASRGNYGLVVHGDDGLDELTTTTSSTVWVYADRSWSAAIQRPTRQWYAKWSPVVQVRSAMSSCSTPLRRWSHTASPPPAGLRQTSSTNWSGPSRQSTQVRQKSSWGSGSKLPTPLTSGWRVSRARRGPAGRWRNRRHSAPS